MTCTDDFTRTLNGRQITSFGDRNDLVSYVCLWGVLNDFSNLAKFIVRRVTVSAGYPRQQQQQAYAVVVFVANEQFFKMGELSRVGCLC